MMRIGIIGYGKMGKRIAEIAESEGHQIVCKITSHNRKDLHLLLKEHIDVAIEFTKPSSALDNFQLLAQKGIPTVTGTTGWLEELPLVESMFHKTGTPFFYASNFSIGVFMTAQLTNLLSKMMCNYTAYKASVKEWHHTEKKDAPSGTALSLAKGIIDHHKMYESSVFQKDIVEANELEIEAYRESGVPGTHEIRFESDIDYIEITHEAKNRDGFVKGALSAALFLVGKPAKTYTMNDLINIPL